MYTNLPTSQGCIFRILQHFATKLCSFSNFPKISFVIPRLKIFLKRKSSIYKQNILEEAVETLSLYVCCSEVFSKEYFHKRFYT